MTNEQREAAERLRKGIDDILFATLYSQEERNTDIDTVLSLIKEQQEEIEKKDKQIDLMAYTLQDNLYLTPLDGLNKEELKQYFEKLAKKGE